MRKAASLAAADALGSGVYFDASTLTNTTTHDEGTGVWTSVSQ